MSYIQDVARDALQAAGSDLAKARRTFMLVAGVLALIHLLTVYPYLQTSQEIVGVEKTIGDNAALLARIEPGVEKLRKAGEDAAAALADLLQGVTEDMIARFKDLQELVERASRGEPIAADAPSSSDISGPPIQQMVAPQTANLPQLQIQGPLPRDPDRPLDPTLPVVPPDLKDILEAIAAEEAEAYEQLTEYARNNFVATTYQGAEDRWSNTIRPAYIAALQTVEDQTRLAADTALASGMEIAGALRTAADEMARQRQAVEAIKIRYDDSVETALGTEWWRTVEGKSVHANAVTQSIGDQLNAISASAGTPVAALNAALDLQEQFRTALQDRQRQLEKQFADQRDQLAALSGTSGVIPVDLATFIGIFPLVLGIALGFVLLRAGEARRQAAIAAGDLAAAGPEDKATRLYLVRRALGGGTAFGPLLLTGGLAIGAVIWIAFAARQVGATPVDPPLSAWTSGGIAVLLVLAAAAWDGAAIRRLAANLDR